MPLGKGGSSFGYDGLILGLSDGNLYVINDAHTHATQYLKLDGSNANVEINVGSQGITTLGDVTCDTLNYTSLNPAIPVTAPAGANTQVQVNNAGVFGADANLTYDFAGTLTVGTAARIPRIKPTADSATAFKITNAAGTTTFFQVDTLNEYVGIYPSVSGPQFNFHVRNPYGVVSAVQTANATYTATQAVINSASVGIALITNGSGSAGTTYGLSNANLVRLQDYGATISGLIIRTATATPLLFGTNNLERARFLSTGQFGLGVTAPAAILEIKAGTATAETAPIKLNTGTSLTVAVAGVIEMTTDDLFFTITTGPARKRLLMADPVGGLTATRIPYATTNGRLTDSANLTTDGTSITLGAGSNVVLATTTGTKIGTATTQLLGFYNATPVDQPATVADAATQDLTGINTIDQAKVAGDLTSCKNAINAIIDRLQELGLIA